MILNDAGEAVHPSVGIDEISVLGKEIILGFPKSDHDADDWSDMMRLALNGDKIAYRSLLGNLASFAAAIARDFFSR